MRSYHHSEWIETSSMVTLLALIRTAYLWAQPVTLTPHRTRRASSRIEVVFMLWLPFWSGADGDGLLSFRVQDPQPRPVVGETRGDDAPYPLDQPPGPGHLGFLGGHLALIHRRGIVVAVEAEAEQETPVEREASRIAVREHRAHDLPAVRIDLVERAREPRGDGRPQRLAVPGQGLDGPEASLFRPPERNGLDRLAVRRIVGNDLTRGLVGHPESPSVERQPFRLLQRELEPRHPGPGRRVELEHFSGAAIDHPHSPARRREAHGILGGDAQRRALRRRGLRGAPGQGRPRRG